EVPLLDGDFLSDSREVEDDDAGSLGLQTGGGMHHKGGLAHLACRQDIAELASSEGVIDLLVGASLDVGGGIGSQVASCYVELAPRFAHEYSLPTWKADS